ncbi:hypothetical protein [uncultured Desulfuromusa sp.]|uniref:hypothetical protein n=1 Tax=uncultured Desulfuromusa sp. TaxID=219183 RepID=UPI0037495088
MIEGEKKYHESRNKISSLLQQHQQLIPLSLSHHFHRSSGIFRLDLILLLT